MFSLIYIDLTISNIAAIISNKLHIIKKIFRYITSWLYNYLKNLYRSRKQVKIICQNQIHQHENNFFDSRNISKC